MQPTRHVDFEEFWGRLSAELRHGRKFSTLVQKKTFEAQMTHRDVVTVRPGSTGTKRDIPMKQFRGMWDIMKNDVGSKRYVDSNERYYDFRSSSYINALIDHVVKDQRME